MRQDNNRSGYSHNRADLSAEAKERILAVLARRARLTPTPKLRAFLGEKDISYLRNERPDHFGWERLLWIAEKLGVDVEINVSREAA